MLNPKVLLIEGSDFETFPAGGQLTMARLIMRLFPGQVALVGMNRSGGVTGRWIQKEIAGVSYPFFPVCARKASWKRPLVPARMTFHAALRRHKDKIFDSGSRSVFTQAPEALLEVVNWDLENICYWFAGVANPLAASRYPYARLFARWFDKRLFAALDRASLILAAADEAAVEQLLARSRGRLSRERLVQVPTCIDPAVFYPMSREDARGQLGIDARSTVFANCGRIARLKGWELLVDAFEVHAREHGDATLIFVGDGEDRPALLSRIQRSEFASRIKITGFQPPHRIPIWLNAADVSVFGSYEEGWSVAMLEALACGKPIVSTEVSGVAEMVVPDRNGFILGSRDPAEFANAMERALRLEDASSVSLSIAAKYDVTRLREQLVSLWCPFRDPEPAEMSVGVILTDCPRCSC